MTSNNDSGVNLLKSVVLWAVLIVLWYFGHLLAGLPFSEGGLL